MSSADKLGDTVVEGEAQQHVLAPATRSAWARIWPQGMQWHLVHLPAAAGQSDESGSAPRTSGHSSAASGAAAQRPTPNLSKKGGGK